MPDNAKLLFNERFFNKVKNEFCEGLPVLQTRARGEDVSLAMKKMFIKRGIELKQMGSTITDGPLGRGERKEPWNE